MEIVMPRLRKNKKEEITPTENQVITKPKVTANDNMVVYNGSVKYFNIKNTLFEKGVPSFAPKKVLTEINDDFEKYDPTKTDYNESEYPIVIYMPISIQYVINAMPTLQRIKECYPYCKLQVLVRDEYIDLLPDGIEVVTSRTGRERYYRTFDLREKTLQTYWINAVVERSTPIHHLLLMSTGLFDPMKDKELPVLYNTKKAETTDDWVMVCDMRFGKPVELVDKIKQSYHINSIQMETVEVGLTISKSRGVIFVGDSPYIYLALYNKMPVMIFMENNKYKHQNQYKNWAGADILEMPKPEAYDAAVKEIGKFIGQSAGSRKQIEKKTIVIEREVSPDIEWS
jgi:hypothetical protein